MSDIERRIDDLNQELTDTTAVEFLGEHGAKREYLGRFDGKKSIIKVSNIEPDSDYPRKIRKISNLRSDLLPETYELVVNRKSDCVQLILVQRALNGVPMSDRRDEKNREAVIDIAFRVLKTLGQYRDSGIAHGDVRQETVFVTPNGPVLLEPTPDTGENRGVSESSTATDISQTAKLVRQLVLPDQQGRPTSGQLSPDDFCLPDALDGDRVRATLEPVVFPQSSSRTLNGTIDALGELRTHLEDKKI